jgi:hypothetical protein
MIDLYNDILSFGNHNEDCTQSRIRPTNQSLAPCRSCASCARGISASLHVVSTLKIRIQV